MSEKQRVFVRRSEGLREELLGGGGGKGVALRAGGRRRLVGDGRGAETTRG